MLHITTRKIIFAMLLIICIALIQNTDLSLVPLKNHQSVENTNSNPHILLNSVSASENVNLNSTGKSYSIPQLTDASSRVNQFIEINRRLPDQVTIGGQIVPMSDFLYLVSRAVVNLDGGVTSSVVHFRVGSPVYSRDQISTGNVLRGEYVGLARDVNSVVQSTGRAPFSVSSSRGAVGFESQVYLFSRIVAFYGSQNRLPNFAGISPWTGPKLPDPPADAPPEAPPEEPSQPNQLVSTGNTYSITQIADASRRIRDFISTNNRLPDQVTIGGQIVPMSDFLYLVSRAVVNLDGGVTSSVVHYHVGSPVYSRDELTTTNILRGGFVAMAKDVNSVVQSTGRAPSSISSEWGIVGFESQVYLFSRIVAFYGSQNRLPNFAGISPWTGPKLPDPPADAPPQQPPEEPPEEPPEAPPEPPEEPPVEPPVEPPEPVELVSTGNSYSIAQLADAGARVRNFIDQNNRLPAHVTISNQQVPMSDFLYLVSRAVVNLDGGVTSSVVHFRVGSPVYSRDQISTGNVLRGEYVGLARDVNSVVQSTGRAPSSISSSRGNIGFESQVYLFSRIVAFYGTQNRLPNHASLSPWNGPKLPDPPAGEIPQEPNGDVKIINSATGGNVTLNPYVNKYLPQTQFSQEIVSKANQGTPMVSFGTGEPQVMIVAGLHGNEIPATIAAMRLINYLDGRKLKGTVHIIPFAIPYTTSINSRLWQGQDPNRIANIPGTPSNIILNKAKELEVAGLGDFHSTQPGGVPGKTSIICTQIPTYQSYNLASYISQQTGSPLINHNTAGVVYPGGLEDEGSKAGIPSIIGEVMCPHGYADSNTINTSYQQMFALLKYYNIL